MKLKRVKPLKVIPLTPPPEKVVKEEKKPKKDTTTTTKKNKKGNTLPSDEYAPILPPTRILVREATSWRNGGTIKQFLEVSVKRFNGNESDSGNIYCWISMYQESDFYTGYLKGKTIYFPIEQVSDVAEILEDLIDEVEDKKLLD